MKALLAVSVLLVCCVAPGAAQRSGTQSDKPAVHTVTIDATSFRPAALTLRPGDTIEWVNKDLIPHTATTPPKAKIAFDSGVIAPGKSWRYTFKIAGDISYVCTFHPTMTGTVKVKR